MPTAETDVLAPAVVDDLFKSREPQRNAAGIYFLTPSDASVQRVIQVRRGEIKES